MKRFFCMFAIAFLFLPSVVVRAEQPKIELAPEARSAILIERDTGAILYEKMPMSHFHQRA